MRGVEVTITLQIKNISTQFPFSKTDSCSRRSNCVPQQRLCSSTTGVTPDTFHPTALMRGPAKKHQFCLSEGIRPTPGQSQRCRCVCRSRRVTQRSVAHRTHPQCPHWLWVFRGLLPKGWTLACLGQFLVLKLLKSSRQAAHTVALNLTRVPRQSSWLQRCRLIWVFARRLLEHQAETTQAGEQD